MIRNEFKQALQKIARVMTLSTGGAKPVVRVAPSTKVVNNNVQPPAAKTTTNVNNQHAAPPTNGQTPTALPVDEKIKTKTTTFRPERYTMRSLKDDQDAYLFARMYAKNPERLKEFHPEIFSELQAISSDTSMPPEQRALMMRHAINRYSKAYTDIKNKEIDRYATAKLREEELKNKGFFGRLWTRGKHFTKDFVNDPTGQLIASQLIHLGLTAGLPLAVGGVANLFSSGSRYENEYPPLENDPLYGQSSPYSPYQAYSYSQSPAYGGMLPQQSYYSRAGMPGTSSSLDYYGGFPKFSSFRPVNIQKIEFNTFNTEKKASLSEFFSHVTGGLGSVKDNLLSALQSGLKNLSNFGYDFVAGKNAPNYQAIAGGLLLGQHLLRSLMGRVTGRKMKSSFFNNVAPWLGAALLAHGLGHKHLYGDPEKGTEGLISGALNKIKDIFSKPKAKNEPGIIDLVNQSKPDKAISQPTSTNTSTASDTWKAHIDKIREDIRSKPAMRRLFDKLYDKNKQDLDYSKFKDIKREEWVAATKELDEESRKRMKEMIDKFNPTFGQRIGASLAYGIDIDKMKNDISSILSNPA